MELLHKLNRSYLFDLQLMPMTGTPLESLMIGMPIESLMIGMPVESPMKGMPVESLMVGISVESLMIGMSLGSLITMVLPFECNELDSLVISSFLTDEMTSGLLCNGPSSKT